MRGTILFDPFPASGHINSMVHFAKFINRHGFKSHFSGLADFMKKIRQVGFEYYIITPFLQVPGDVDKRENGPLKVLMDNLDLFRFKKLKTGYEKFVYDYDRMIESVQPDIILLDDHYAFKALFYQKYGIPIITVQTMIPPIKSFGVPPFQSSYIPGNGVLSDIYTELLWRQRMFYRSLADYKNIFLTLGNTNLKILQKLCPSSGLTIDYNRCFGVGVSQLPMISTSPKAFDFPQGSNHSKVYYYGKQESFSDQKMEDPRLLSILSKAYQQKKTNPDKILIYCSLGTVLEAGNTTRKKFYNKLISAAAQTPNVEFILSIGKHFDVNNLSRIPENMYVFASVPQESLLRHIDIMITHGGLNSIRECIDTEVPMIIYPLTNKWDQPGNAARAAFHNLGLQGNIKRATPRSISNKIRAIYKERDSYRNSLRDMKRKIEISNLSEENKIIELINEMIKKNTNKIQSANEIH